MEPTSRQDILASGEQPAASRHEPASDLMCSARGCGASADFALRWNNPRLHTPERRKTWLACTAHRDALAGHLEVRGFLRETVPVAELTG